MEGAHAGYRMRKKGKIIHIMENNRHQKQLRNVINISKNKKSRRISVYEIFCFSVSRKKKFISSFFSRPFSRLSFLPYELPPFSLSPREEKRAYKLTLYSIAQKEAFCTDRKYFFVMAYFFARASQDRKVFARGCPAGEVFFCEALAVSLHRLFVSARYEREVPAPARLLFS